MSDDITLRLTGGVAREIRSICEEHDYEPSELLILGASLAEVLLKEKAIGHKFIITTEQGEPLKELLMPEKQARKETMPPLSEKDLSEITFLEKLYDAGDKEQRNATDGDKGHTR